MPAQKRHTIVNEMNSLKTCLFLLAVRLHCWWGMPPSSAVWAIRHGQAMGRN